jgi:hypothetical protein
MTIFGSTARTLWAAQAAARIATTVLHTRGLTAMRLRSVIFILLQLSLPFVAAVRLILNAGGEQGNVVRKGLLVNNVEPIGDKEESGPITEKDVRLRLRSM